MRGHRVLWVVAVAAVLAAAGCADARHAPDAVASSAPASAAHARAPGPAPTEPDLATVMERFYQQVEGAHWRFADAMLSARLRAQLGPNGVRARYDRFADLDVTLRQTTASSVVASLTAVDRSDRSRRLRFEETVTLAWDGEQWTIDRLARREITAGTR